MPRTLPAALTTVMDAGIYEPYIRVVVCDDPLDAGSETVQPLAFTIEPLRATIKIAWTDDPCTFFRIVRGALINGAPSTISTIWWRTIEYKYDGKFIELTGEPLARSYLSIAADSVYETVIETALTDLERTIVPNYEGAGAWTLYKFYPAGRSIVLSPRKKLFSLLQQKYLVFATEDGWDGSQDNIFFFVATQTRATDYTVIDPLFNYNGHFENRKLIWRDEAGTIHTLGTATDSLFNLGYLESTDADPVDASTPGNQGIGARSSKLPVHLKYRTGDRVTFTLDANLAPGTFRVKVTEVLDLQSTPAWYVILEPLVYFSGTEGGPMPSTIEAAAPYTPLATGNFAGVLNANDNNLQAAMEKIDDHHSALAPAINTPTTTDDFLVGAQVATVWTWVRKTLAQTITILRTSLDAIYAPIAKGVTNGDAHDHVGGDGGMVAYGSLSGALAQAAGTYTPTLTNTTNIDASTVTGPFIYMQVGNFVSCEGVITVDPTAAGNTILGISLPIVSNFTATSDGGGVGMSQSSNTVGGIGSDATNDRMTLTFQATVTTSTGWRVMFMYEIK